MPRPLTFATLLVVVAACSTDSALGGFDQAEIEVGSHSMTVLIAETPSQRNQGLRNVDELPVGVEGMLFVFEAPTTATFGMRDTLLSLDVWWFDQDGRLIGSAEMKPCPTEPCTNYRSPPGVRWVLETPVGETELGPEDVLNVALAG
ncbi:MAG TPA: DUF192 domain-containing protein [Acidimicrobiia bacterium]|nr:DUF192 domain-containing protein [Acidimicrobiia bacterium]